MRKVEEVKQEVVVVAMMIMMMIAIIIIIIIIIITMDWHIGTNPQYQQTTHTFHTPVMFHDPVQRRRHHFLSSN
jgi:hypothetical protein